MTALKDALDALRPFATLFEVESPRWHRVPDDCPIIVGPGATVTVGDLRRAATAVEAIEKMKDAPPPPAGDMVLVPREALDWLLGQGPDAQGYWFGDYEDNSSALNEKRPAFWWRSKFRAMVAAAPLPAQEREVSDGPR